MKDLLEKSSEATEDCSYAALVEQYLINDADRAGQEPGKAMNAFTAPSREITEVAWCMPTRDNRETKSVKM